MANGTIAFDTLTTSDSVNTNTEKSIDTSYIYNGVAKVWFTLDVLDALLLDSFKLQLLQMMEQWRLWTYI